MSQQGMLGSKYAVEDRLLTEILKPSFRSLTKIETYLSQNNIDPNKGSRYGNNAIHHAAKVGNIAVLRMLVDAGGDPRTLNHVGASPLIIASRGVERGHSSCVKYLLELDDSYGIDVNAIDNEGRTALRQAILSSNVRSVELLLQHGSHLSWDEHDTFSSSKNKNPYDDEPIAFRFASWLSTQYQNHGSGNEWYASHIVKLILPDAIVPKFFNPYEKILELLHKTNLSRRTQLQSE